jgi:hypothetical protein
VHEAIREDPTPPPKKAFTPDKTRGGHGPKLGKKSYADRKASIAARKAQFKKMDVEDDEPAVAAKEEEEEEPEEEEEVEAPAVAAAPADY